MIKSVGKRFLSIALVIMMVFSLLPVIQMSASAADVTGLADSSIGLSYDNGTWTASGQTVNGSVTGTSSTCGSDSTTGTLTIKNTKSTEATLSFSYTPTLNNGSVTVDENNVTAKGTFSKVVSAGGTVKIVLTSAEGANTTSITITGITLIKEGNATVTFQPGEHGSYKVDGTAITQQTQITKSSAETFTLVATAASGYRFFAWQRSDGSYLSFDANYTLQTDSDITIKPVFVSSSAPVFKVDGAYFTDLNEAVSYATANSKPTIILASNGTLPAGDYTIPSGKTLLIPMNSTEKVYTTSPEAVRTTAARSAFRTLTLASGAKLIVNGAVSVPGQYYAAAGGNAGTMTSTYGRIAMQSGSQIVLNNGANLYAWGYITGDGIVTAESGSTVYEWFQLTDFRGGTESTSLGNKVFPFSQYYVQNIEAALTLKSGATETVRAALYAGGGTREASVDFIGKTTGMFRLNSGEVTKKYNGARDRLEITLNGVMTLSNLNVSVSGLSVNSKDYILPINNNISLDIVSGSLSITQDTALQPGVEVSVANAASINVSSGSNVYIYDSDLWGNFCGAGGKGKFIAVQYAPGKTYNRTASDIKDVVVDINGTFSTAGTVYTTSGGANICSTGETGKFVLQSAPRTATKTYQYVGSTATEIPITAAQLKNGVADPQFTATAGSTANTTFSYCATHDMWEKGDGYTVSFDANGGDGSMEDLTTCPAGSVTLAANTFTRSGYAFKEWNTAADGSGTAYADEAEITVAADTTLYAQWDKLYTVTWQNEDGTVLETDVNVAADTMPEYNGAIPTKDETESSYYVFSGWKETLEPVSGNVTYTAKYDENPLSYHIDVYYNLDGARADETTFSTDFRYDKSVRLGAEAKYTKDGQTYFFSHWDVNGEQFAAQQITLRPGVGGVTLTAQAVFVADESQAMAKDPLLKVIVEKSETIGKDTALEAHKLVFTVTQSVPSGTAEAVGFVVGYAPNPELGGDNVFVATSDLQKATSVFTTRVNVTGRESQAIYVRAYLTYKDGDTSKTIYSESKPYTFPIPNS